MGTFTKITDVLKSNEGRAFVTMNGQNRRLFELSKIEAVVETKTRSKQMLGNRMEQTKATGQKISGSLTLYHMTSDWLEFARTYKETGRMPSLSLLIVNEDPASTVGRSEVLLTGVILTKTGLGMLSDSDDSDVTFDTDFTAGDYEIIRKFDAIEA